MLLSMTPYVHAIGIWGALNGAPRSSWDCACGLSISYLSAELFQDKLSKTKAQVVWKDYSPSHFCGSTGTFNGIDESIPGVPAREKCEPASVGEFWWVSRSSSPWRP